MEDNETLTPEQSELVRVFVWRLARPLYVYRMANAGTTSSNPAMAKSAKARFRNSEKEIHDLILDYIAESYPDAQLDG